MDGALGAHPDGTGASLLSDGDGTDGGPGPAGKDLLEDPAGRTSLLLLKTGGADARGETPEVKRGPLITCCYCVFVFPVNAGCRTGKTQGAIQERYVNDRGLDLDVFHYDFERKNFRQSAVYNRVMSRRPIFPPLSFD